MPNRRAFLTSTAVSSMAASCGLTGPGLPRLTAAETEFDPTIVRFGNGIEWLVQLIEETDRNELIERVAHEVKKGLSYRELLAASFLAGIRNVQPRPSVGFKFHAVLVVNSAHLASMASTDSDRWLPLFWTIDNFKSSQARDVREGNWTMAPVAESRVPSVDKARIEFIDAMDQWDVSKADVAVAGLSRTAGMNEVFELFARYGARDFRSIGHKAIYVANSYRTLQCIGWQHREPILRSLAYALLNHEGHPNPAQNDLENDRPWRSNEMRLAKVRDYWQSGSLSSDATREFVTSLRSASPDEACDQVVEMLNANVSPQSIYDALYLASGELMMRQPAIVALHSVTTTNALHYAYQTVSREDTRLMMLLQNAAFIPMFRNEMSRRGKLADQWVTEIESVDDGRSVNDVFSQVGRNSVGACENALSFLDHGGSASELISEARRYIFLKGTDSHDYKYSSAVLEDYFHISPEWRNRFLAASVFRLKGANSKDNGLIHRINRAIS